MSTSGDARLPAPPATVAVWDLPLRLCHWALAASVLVAWFSANVDGAVHEISGYTPRVLLRYLSDLAQGRTTLYLGHNPAGAAMTVLLLVLLAIATITGWMQLTRRFFGVTWVEMVHTYSSNLVLVLAIVHVLGVLLMCWLQKENLVRAMITGRKRAASEHKEDG